MKSGISQRTSGEINCIWMSSGVIKYKLCDKEFDCENCEFDKVIRNLSPAGNSIKIADKINEPQNEDLLERVIKKVENEFYDEKIIYLKNQLVLKNLFGNAFYIGINPIVLILLDNFNSIHEFQNNEIKRDQIIFTLEGPWGIKQFISPINFMVIEKINFSQFMLNQWYAVILFNENDKDDFRLAEEEWLAEKNSILSVLKSNLIKKPDVGISLPDGGERIKYLYQYLGKKEYIELINKSFT